MKVALVQAQLLWVDVPGNLFAFNQRLEQVSGVDMIVLPEMFSSGFSMEGKEKIALHYEEVREQMAAWARQKDALVVGSTIYEEEQRYFNRLIAAFPGGGVSTYDKRHCFSMGGEDKHFTPGKERVIVAYKGIKIAPFICYDLRFPVWSRNDTGYDVALYVANWPEARREAWKRLLQARAIENQAYVVGVNRVGKDGNGLNYAGDSMALSPKGDVMVSCEPHGDMIVQVELDFTALQDFRTRFPVLEDRDDFSVMV